MPRLRQVPRAEVTDEKILYFYDRLFGPDKDPAVDGGTSQLTSSAVSSMTNEVCLV